jgi:hypothetical protein
MIDNLLNGGEDNCFDEKILRFHVKAKVKKQKPKSVC